MKRSTRIVLALGVLAVVGGGVVMLRSQPPAAAPAVPAQTLVSARQSVLSVTLVASQSRDWPQVLAASGALAAWQEAVIGAEVGALRITDLSVDVGSVVKKGQELARLSQDSTRADLRKQEAQVAQSKASLAQAQANAKRALVVKDSGALSAQQVTEYLIAEQTAQASLDAAQAELESIRITLDKTIIRAVDDGVITARSATLGNVVSAGTELFRLVRQNRVEWQAELDAQQILQAKPGQKAVLSLPDGSRVEGQVRMTAPSLSTSTSRGVVYVALPPGSGATLGSYASGEIELPAKPARVVPQSAIVLRDGRSYVFTVDAAGKASRHLVGTGRRRDGWVEILDGLDSQARVVESGGAFLSDGAAVTVIGAATGTERRE